ncbi:hypothetical protein P5673_007983 [Acropora cervicornis]|uniref:Uncharacterized protein n=1 Tax=Acropora cervicornis TaxID=6130 RepID=A0AAD9QV29_ACRCE|nr:hypothetical protein P5673_007983 [Acropora cervicornis]
MVSSPPSSPTMVHHSIIQHLRILLGNMALNMSTAHQVSPSLTERSRMRRARTLLPITNTLLKPAVPTNTLEKMTRRKAKQGLYINGGTKELTKLNPGDAVRVKLLHTSKQNTPWLRAQVQGKYVHDGKLKTKFLFVEVLLKASNYKLSQGKHTVTMAKPLTLKLELNKMASVATDGANKDFQPCWPQKQDQDNCAQHPGVQYSDDNSLAALKEDHLLQILTAFHQAYSRPRPSNSHPPHSQQGSATDPLQWNTIGVNHFC